MFNKMGKYSALCGSSLLILMAAANVQAADGEVEFTGSITDGACTITGSSVKQAVKLPQVRVADFANTVGATTGKTPFSISLEDCSTETKKNASITFSGVAAATDPDVLGMTGENRVGGVGIQIGNKAGEKLALNTASVDHLMTVGSNTFDFSAAYVRLVADVPASDGVPAQVNMGTGIVNALATFDVSYK
ncbi:type 1 fimbrial protein [Pseudomonas sp. ArH3a]|uniref:fimbrial protein n=1 Tax=Pseudomonas sp. ArH3a TaxID=2862945 RepID=UPI001F56DCA1|nr:fimbrial protein [Pseudomonas sp. ArH3a]UNM20060.1 type 1 fimbrial protein [Pseudomonas sp. ArH3a]